MNHPPIRKNPLVLEINARVLLQSVTESAANASRHLGDVSDTLLASWGTLGFDAIWIMGIWTTGEAGREISLNGGNDYRDSLPDWTPEDVAGSPYSIKDYHVDPAFGGDEALAILREKMAAHGLSLILDFVPNHTAPDHAWVKESPHYYIEGSEALLQDQPQNYTRQGDRIYAYGRDPYFAGWSDTLQLDYRRAATREAMAETLMSISKRCDGVRCDMSMLVLSDVFMQTWGPLANEEVGVTEFGETEFSETEFWAEVIDRVRAAFPEFKFIAEAYWGLEERLQMLGFDFTYHKSLYDHLEQHRTGQARAVLQSVEIAKRSLFFIENHDEVRATSAFPEEGHRRAAAFLLLTLPGMRLVHEGQMEGRQKHHSVHLSRRFEEAVNESERAFYERLLLALPQSCVGQGEWRPLEIHPAAGGESQSEHLVACLWEQPGSEPCRTLAISNFSNKASEGLIRVMFFEVGGRHWVFEDCLSEESYRRDGTEISGDPGLYVHLAPYQHQLFTIKLSD